jgi:hypothetical protein
MGLPAHRDGLTPHAAGECPPRSEKATAWLVTYLFGELVGLGSHDGEMAIASGGIWIIRHCLTGYPAWKEPAQPSARELARRPCHISQPHIPVCLDRLAIAALLTAPTASPVQPMSSK